MGNLFESKDKKIVDKKIHFVDNGFYRKEG
jgi:hypothetical protein